MANIYTDGTYLDQNPSWHSEDAAWKADHVSRLLQRNSLDAKTICEVGCGVGEILKQLSENYSDKDFTGYEISPDAFDQCKQKTKPNLHFYLEDMLTKDDIYYDVAMALDVFEHVEDYIGFLRRLKTKARYKVFHIPLDLSVQSVLRGSPIMRLRKSVGHIHYFTKDTALATLSDAGYELVDYFYTRGSMELANRGLKASLVRWPRQLLFSINEDLAVRLLGGCSLMVLTR